ncbi:membrane protein [Bacteroidia bacterium]|nr:membrane protein [Bacteroidia bacterium]
MIMKANFVKCILFFVLAGFTVACSSNDEFLKENLYGQLFPETFYSNQDELDMANNALYSRMSRLFDGDYATFVVMLYGGDDITVPYSAHTQFVQPDILVHQAGSQDMQDGWEVAYSTINIANGIINNYRNAAGAVSEPNLQEAVAQAYFARAYAYFWLVRIYNEIPYITTVMELDRTVTKSSPEAVYDAIVSDLKKAEEWLPYQWTDKKANGGFTKGAAKAVLANVYLTMAGYPLKKTECYTLAKDKAAELIDKAEYGYKLLDDFADLWKPTPLTNDELVFGIFYNKSTDNYTVRAPKECRPIQFGGWEYYCAEINFYKKFPDGKRKEVTFVTEFPLLNSTPNAEPVIPWPDDQPMLSWEKMLFKHPYYFKMWESEGYEGENKWKKVNDADWRCGRTNQHIRYAEVLLIYAEAQAMADGAPNALAYDCINRVRNRAFAGGGTHLNDLPPGLSATAFRDSVFVERGWEFAGFEYASRWFDLVRLELVEDAASEHPVHSFLPGRAPTEWKIETAPTHDNYFAPLPEQDVLLNPNLKK